MQTRKNNIYFQIVKVCDILDIMKIFLKNKMYGFECIDRQDANKLLHYSK